MSSINNTTSIQSLTLLSEQLTIILGFVILISGFFGNLMNIILLLNLGSVNNNACSFYIFVKSFFDFVTLFVGLGTRILNQGFHIDLTLFSRLWCKFRIPFLDMTTLCSFSCLCFQSIDTFFSSSRSVSWRRKSNIKVARCLLLGFMCVWILMNIPYFFFQELVLNAPTRIYRCVTINGNYALFRSYFIVVGLYFIIPIIIVGVFGFLTCRQLQRLTVQQRRSLSALNKQMARMVLFQIIVVLIFIAPHALVTIYSIGTAGMIKTAYRLAVENVIQVVFNMYGYGALSVRKLLLRRTIIDQALFLLLDFVLLLLHSIPTIS